MRLKLDENIDVPVVALLRERVGSAENIGKSLGLALPGGRPSGEAGENGVARLAGA